jgi:hypothetical protein
MNCAAWEERILLQLEGDADTQAAEHMLICPACAAFAAGLADDARILRLVPPEAAAVDYAAIRTAARREAVRRTRRRRVLAALAVAAAVLLASRIAIHRDAPQSAHRSPTPPPAAELARVAPPAPPSTIRPVPTARTARPHRPKAQPDLDRQFAEYLHALDDRQHPPAPPANESPVVMRIATSNPNVTILLLQASKGPSL